jgi:predicted metal-dependent enzyme (double-stranded beta helix superfamily)
MNHIAIRPPLDSLLAGIAAAARGPLAGRPAEVSAVLRAFAGSEGLLDAMDCPCCPANYARHLLADGAGYAVLALVWRPGQMSPVHAHRAWCALAVHEGTLVETFHDPEDPARPVSARLLGPGQGSAGLADPRLIHRLANLSGRNALSLHVYGVAFDQLGTDLNDIRN